MHEYDDRGVLGDDSWRRIATWVGEWPLALELLNAALRMGAVSPGELLDAARASGPARELERQMGNLRGAVAEGTLRGVAEALAMSYRRLPEEARVAARQLAWLAPDPIPRFPLSLPGASASQGDGQPTQFSAGCVVLSLPSSEVGTISLRLNGQMNGESASLHRLLDMLAVRGGSVAIQPPGTTYDSASRCHAIVST